MNKIILLYLYLSGSIPFSLFSFSWVSVNVFLKCLALLSKNWAFVLNGVFCFLFLNDICIKSKTIKATITIAAIYMYILFFSAHSLIVAFSSISKDELLNIFVPFIERVISFPGNLVNFSAIPEDIILLNLILASVYGINLSVNSKYSFKYGALLYPYSPSTTIAILVFLSFFLYSPCVKVNDPFGVTSFKLSFSLSNSISCWIATASGASIFITISTPIKLFLSSNIFCCSCDIETSSNAYVFGNNINIDIITNNRCFVIFILHLL